MRLTPFADYFLLAINKSFVQGSACRLLTVAGEDFSPSADGGLSLSDLTTTFRWPVGWDADVTAVRFAATALLMPSGTVNPCLDKTLSIERNYQMNNY